MIFENVVLFD